MSSWKCIKCQFLLLPVLLLLLLLLHQTLNPEP
jgi:hypothetical protein